MAGSISHENEFGAAQLDITTDVSQGYDKKICTSFTMLQSFTFIELARELRVASLLLTFIFLQIVSL